MKLICIFPPGSTKGIVPTFPGDWDVHVVARAADITDEIARGADVVLLATHCAITREILVRLRGVRLFQRLGVGVETIDLEAARELGIRVANTAGVNAVAVAEYVIMAAIFLMRRVPELTEAGRRGLNPFPAVFAKGCREVRGKKLGIVGYGAIGHQVALRARALGMEVASASVRGRPPGPQEAQLGVRRLAFEELLADSDIVSLHVPLAPETQDLIRRPQLERMKRGACLINVARGGVVDEADLAQALHDGLLGGAAVDTFTVEPMPLDSPLVAAPNVLLTPHTAGATNECIIEAVGRSLDNVRRVLRGEEPLDRVV
jgi:phosphoglycerate dehydrogenase-like enzyme